MQEKDIYVESILADCQKLGAEIDKVTYTDKYFPVPCYTMTENMSVLKDSSEIILTLCPNITCADYITYLTY